MNKRSKISVDINIKVEKLAKAFCESNGVAMSKFIEDAILDKLKESEDLKDLEKLRQEPSKLFSKDLFS